MRLNIPQSLENKGKLKQLVDKFEFVDPIGLYEKIQALEADIEGFKSNVDTVLAVTNAITAIEVDF